MQAQALGGFIAKRAPVKLFDASTIVGSETFDVRHVATELGAVQLYKTAGVTGAVRVDVVRAAAAAR
jgi:hypothetical protein